VIAYFDTSALIPLVVEEPGSRLCARLWDEAAHVVSVRIAYAEGRAALAQAHRLGRLTSSALRGAVFQFDVLYGQLDRIEVDDDLVFRAGLLAEEQALRGYDAVHLAAAERIQNGDAVLVSGDAQLCRAARQMGFAVSQPQ
jgi:uncharacterized protein